jgi:hypothetical protein
VALKILQVYDLITKLFSHYAEVIQNHDNENIRNTGQEKAQNIKDNMLTHGSDQVYDR